MKKESIKKHLKAYVIYRKRQTTINHAFASAIAPYDEYNEKVVNDALKFLGQNPSDSLNCVFCNKKAETWDHLTGLVEKGELRGFGHQVGNLVPCCTTCNSSKGSKDFELFIKQHDEIIIDQINLIDLLSRYQTKYAKKIDLKLLQHKQPDVYREFTEVKKEIFNLMKKADKLAEILRNNILS